MRKKTKGFALLQALFFMMFIMAVISITMLMSGQRAVSAEGDRLATDAYPAISALLSNTLENITASTPSYGPEYFLSNPLSTTYINALTAEGFSDPSQCFEISVDGKITSKACTFVDNKLSPANQNSNLTITMS